MSIVRASVDVLDVTFSQAYVGGSVPENITVTTNGVDNPVIDAAPNFGLLEIACTNDTTGTTIVAFNEVSPWHFFLDPPFTPANPYTVPYP